MRIKTTVYGATAILAVMLTGCYNNPEVSARTPGEGPQNIHSKPSVGPGTVPGGSTAGPQPPTREHAKEGHTEPQADHGKH